MVLGKLETSCEAPTPSVILGDEIIDQPNKIIECDDNFNAPASFDFPDVGLLNPSGGSAAETSLGKRFPNF